MLNRGIDNPKIEIFVKVFAAVAIIAQLYMLLFTATSPGILRPLHVFFVCTMAYFCVPKPGKSDRTKLIWWIIDTILYIGVIGSTLHIWLDDSGWLFRMTNAMTDTDIAFSVVMVIFILVFVQRCVGWPLVILCSIFLLYAFVGQHIPGFLHMLPIKPRKIFSIIYNVQGSFYGSLCGTSVTYCLPFVVMGKIMEICGTGNYFTDFANRLAGKTRGGPAKVATISSCIFGTISGAGAANAVATGTFTIPLMKATGYPSHFAAAVEAVASSGGQIMPPIMASAGFLAAELSGIPYGTIALAAVVPALIYYINLYFAIDFTAGKHNLRGLRESQLQRWSYVLKKSYLFAPVIVVMLTMLVLKQSPLRGAAYGMIIGVALFYINPKTRQPLVKSLGMLLNTMLRAGTSFITVGLAFFCASIVSSLLNMTGLAVKASSLLLSVGQGNLLFSLVLTALLTIILGMGLPVTASYVISTSVCVSALTELGVPLLAAHMFLLHFSSLSSITPPVCLAAYAAAGISGDSPLKVGATACKIGIVSFVIPFFFAYNSDMLWVINGWLPAIRTLITAVIGVVAMSGGVVGWAMNGRMPVWLRIISFAGGLMLVHPASATDYVGIIVCVAVFLCQKAYVAARKKSHPEEFEVSDTADISDEELKRLEEEAAAASEHIMDTIDLE